MTEHDTKKDTECRELATVLAPLVADMLRGRAVVSDTPHGTALVHAVSRAVDELEECGPKSARIALQLIGALAQYEQALHAAYAASPRALVETYLRNPFNGPPTRHESVPAPEDAPEPLYALERCEWEDGGDESMQEWERVPTFAPTEDRDAADRAYGRLQRDTFGTLRYRVVEVPRA